MLALALCTMLFTLSFTVSTVLCQSVGTQLQALLDAAANKLPGAMLYISSPGSGTWTGAAGVGNIETGMPMRHDDKFRAGSIMKPFVSVVVLQLVEEGLISLDDPMTAILSESVTTKFADSDQITMRMLLNHTSGIPDSLTEAVYAEIATNPAKIWTDEEWLDISAAQEPYFPPGQGWQYSNTGYVLLGLVIEEITGSSWRESVRERVIKPLNLQNTLLPEPGDLSIPGNYVHGYHPINGEVIDITGVDPSMAGAAGGSALVTTTSDLSRFLDMLFAGELFQNAETLDEMLTYVDAPDEQGVPYWYGLGIEKYAFPGGIEAIGHSGGTAGYASDVSYIPALGITIAASVNVQDVASLFLEIIVPAVSIIAAGPAGDFSNVFFMPLSPGLNMISLPLKSPVPYTARSLAEEISATMVIKYDETLRRFVGFSSSGPDDGFPIEGGKGYIVNVPKGGTFAFSGAPWTNQPPVSAAPPSQIDSAWAFVVSGSLIGGNIPANTKGDYTVTVRNLITGDVAMETAHNGNGYFAAAYADLNRRAVVKVGDRIELVATDSSGNLLSGPYIHEVTLDEIKNAVLSVELRLGHIIPQKSSLLQNYPNPFNPETWMPYNLRDSSPVVIRIHNASGKLIKTLDLGYRDAGIYSSKAEAAYWNGRNEAGEKVASGIYYYTITAGNFSATRKMVVTK